MSPARVASYSERLVVSWWMWLGGLVVAVLLAAEIHLGADGVRSWLPYIVLPLVIAGVLGWLSRMRLEVADGELRIDDAHIPLRFLASAEPLDAAARHRALGHELHPLAFVVQRPWVPSAVLIVLDDSDDPTPYWVISTRHPERLLEVLGLPRPAPSEPRPDEESAARR